MKLLNFIFRSSSLVGFVGLCYFLFLVACGSAAKVIDASEKPLISCEFVKGWDFERCENAEVICYTNDRGLSCKFK